MEHFPVMLPEVMEILKPQAGEVYFDGTFGVGGYSRAILEATNCSLIALDRDPEAKQRAESFKQEYKERFHFILGCFDEIKAKTQEFTENDNGNGFDGIVFDLGVSSPQLDQAERGFSFRQDGPLDMRMGDGGFTAADVIANHSQEALSTIFFEYGEERYGKRIAAAIIKARNEKSLIGERIERTLELAKIIESAVPKVPAYRKGKKLHTIDPATRCFQALRIYVNKELDQIEAGLAQALQSLKPGGRLIVVSFHSLEDRIVKNFMKNYANEGGGGSRYAPPIASKPALLTLIGKGVISASESEINQNNRSRSAKLRAAIRTQNPFIG